MGNCQPPGLLSLVWAGFIQTYFQQEKAILQSSGKYLNLPETEVELWRQECHAKWKTPWDQIPIAFLFPPNVPWAKSCDVETFVSNPFIGVLASEESYWQERKKDVLWKSGLGSMLCLALPMEKALFLCPHSTPNNLRGASYNSISSYEVWTLYWVAVKCPGCHLWICV